MTRLRFIHSFPPTVVSGRLVEFLVVATTCSVLLGRLDARSWRGLV